MTDSSVNRLNRDLGGAKITDNVYNSVPAGGATSVYGKTIEMTKGTDNYYLTINAEKELLVGFRNNPNEANIWKKYVSASDFQTVDCHVTTVANTSREIPGAPKSGNWMAKVIVHEATLGCLENVINYGETWHIYSTVAQNVLIRFFKYPI